MRENVGKFIIANIRYFSESEILAGLSGIWFAEFTKVFPHQIFALYGYYAVGVDHYPSCSVRYSRVCVQMIITCHRYCRI